ncbi:MAG: glycerate kinase type-2 family protein, partial [Chitinophagaceae bacterium]
MKFRNHASDIMMAAIDAVQPRALMKKNLLLDKKGLHINEYIVDPSSIQKLIVIAAGKAASAMAAEAETFLGKQISCGLCITKYHHSLPLKKFRTIEAGHPLPDENSIRAGEAVLGMVHNLSPDDIVLIFLSGGASSLLADIPENCSLADLQETSETLVKSGASIDEINIVRKHLSRIKGGQLAKAAQPARVYTCLISDVVGDDMSSIGSGPTVPDNSSFHDAFKVLQNYNAWQNIPATIKSHIERGIKAELAETPKPGDLFFQNTFTKIIGNNRLALLAAKGKAEQLGYHAIILAENITGNTESVSRKFINDLLQYKGP